MGILTSAYRVPASIIHRLIAEPELIDQLFYPDYREEGDAGPEDVGLQDWEPQRHGFDKVWEDHVGLYRQIERYRLYGLLDTGATEVENKMGAWVRYWTPEEVVMMA